MSMETTAKVQMLQISSVKRVHSKAILILSNGTSVCMPRIMLRERPYRSGMPFDPQSFEVFLRERSYSFAIEKSIALLASRARTEKEIEDYLRLNAYPEITIARVMSRLLDAGYLNDSDFAAAWAQSRNSKNLGGKRIRMELRNKGVAQEDIEAAMASLDESDVFSSAVRAAEKAARGKQFTSPADRQKIIAALARRGYDFTLAKQALQHIIDRSE